MHRSLLLGLACTMSVCAATRYVALDGGHVPPFTDGWAGAATNIQDAIDSAATNDIILVSNGVYRTGSRLQLGLTNRVVVPYRMTLRSLNGASATAIEGAGPYGFAAIRCVYLASGALLDGFTLTNGFTAGAGSTPQYSGGGVYCADSTAVISNCHITRCVASWGGGVYGGTVYNSILARNGLGSGIGGGAYNATFYNCLFAYNVANQGGGAFGCALYNCTVASNTAAIGGGVRDSSAYNSIVYHNTASTGPDHYGFTSYYTCTPPGAFLSGSANITNNPAFIDDAGDYHLRTNSPCIDSGTNMAWMTDARDLDGRARILGGRVDMGAYEFIPEPAGTVLCVICMALAKRPWRGRHTQLRCT